MAEATTRRDKLKEVQQAVLARKAGKAAGGAPRNAELERAILRNPRAKGPWQVYADWLQSQGDLRGELAALVQRKPELVDAFIGKHWKTLFGAGAALFNDYTATVEEWRPGFVGRLRLALDPENEVQHDLVEVTHRLMQLPICSLLDGLELECDPELWAAALDHVVRGPQAASLRLLEVSSPAGWFEGGDLSGVLSRLPALEIFRIDGSGCKLGSLVLPQLRELVRTGGPLTGSEIRSLSRAELPKLERVQITSEHEEETDEPEGERDSPEGLLEALVARATLRELTLDGYHFDDALIEVLLESDCMPKLQLLDLSGCSLDPEAIGVLAEEVETLRDLPRLHLPGDLAEDLGLDPAPADEEDGDEDEDEDEEEDDDA